MLLSISCVVGGIVYWFLEHNAQRKYTLGEAGDTDKFQPTVEQQLAAEAGAGVNQAGQQIVGRQLSVPPTIEVRPGWPFNVMVNKDIVLKPYED